MSNKAKSILLEKNDIAAPFPFVISIKDRNFSRKLVIDQKLKPVNPLQCGRQMCPAGHSYSSSARDYWLLHFVISGKGVLLNQNGAQRVCENEMFVTRPFESVTYTADIEDPWQYIWIGFTTEAPLPPILEEKDVIAAPYLKDFFVNAYDNEYFENADTHGAYEYYLCGSIWQIFSLLLQNGKKDMTVTDNYIKPALTLMELYYYDIGLTVSELAARLHITREHFSRIFKAETGISPKQYLNEIRMKKAQMLLTQKSDNITWVAQSVGFSDLFSFSRAFSRYYGCSPMEYRGKR